MQNKTKVIPTPNTLKQWWFLPLVVCFLQGKQALVWQPACSTQHVERKDDLSVGWLECWIKNKSQPVSYLSICCSVVVTDYMCVEVEVCMQLSVCTFGESLLQLKVSSTNSFLPWQQWSYYSGDEGGIFITEAASRRGWARWVAVSFRGWVRCASVNLRGWAR